ncbi:hypothetical protein F5X97DRAFT_224977 [Nemania serpens]|nr:hypothetical protein F5X97DRAFT_224977 [Nemania serpens]
MMDDINMDKTETKEYTIVPGGDVIIRLSNFDPPFAVLKPGEELYLPTKHKGLFGKSSFGAPPSSSTPLFGSPTASGSAGAFGSTATSGSTSAFGSTGAFGSSRTFGSAGTSGSTGGFGGFGGFGSTGGSGSAGLFGSTDRSGGGFGGFGSTGGSGPSGLFGSATASGSTGGFGGFGSTGGFGSAGGSGSTGLFGSPGAAGSTGAFGSTGVFGSTGYGSTRAFGSAGASDSTAPSGFAAAFGSSVPSGSNTVPSVSTAASSSPSAVGSSSTSGPTPAVGSTGAGTFFLDLRRNQSQSPSDDVEHESSSAASQAPTENTVSPEEEPEPSIAVPEIHFKVSSAHLKLASRYFQKAFDSNFKESQPDSDGTLRIDASDWDTEALLIVLRIIHGQNRQIPRQIDLELLAKIAVIVDYYDCREIVDAFAELWLQRLKSRFILLHKLDRELVLLLLVSWVFGWANEFKLATKIVLRQSKGLLRTLELPIPEAITSTLNTRRLESLHRISFMLGSLVARFQTEPPLCSFECASMNLGALSRQMRNKKELYEVGNMFSTLDGQNIASTMEAARTIRSPNWSCGRKGSPCDLNPRVNKEVDRLDNIEGLNLEDFARDS